MLDLIYFAVLIVNVLGKNEEYIGYKVYSVDLNDTQEEYLYKIKSDHIDFWRKPCVKHNVVGKAMVRPSYANWFEKKLDEVGIEKEVYIEDVYEYLTENERLMNQNVERVFDFNSYHRYDVILNYLYELQEVYANSSTTVELIVFGETDENRPLVYLKLTHGNESYKPVAVIEAAINPRDWVTVPSAINVVNKLLEEQNRRLLEDIVWIVIPVLNPDGYEYTHTNSRLWTKSRSIRSHLGHICPGVQIDRNFNIDWQISDSSSSPCSHIYAGIHPASEPETQMIYHLLEEYSPRYYISIQNSGDFITYPWRYEKAASGLFRRHFLKGLEAVNAVEGYTLDVGAMAIGDRESGTSVDFARFKRVFYTYNIGVGGEVIVPEEDIMRIAENVWIVVSTITKE